MYDSICIKRTCVPEPGTLVSAKLSHVVITKSDPAQLPEVFPSLLLEKSVLKSKQLFRKKQTKNNNKKNLYVCN